VWRRQILTANAIFYYSFNGIMQIIGVAMATTGCFFSRQPAPHVWQLKLRRFKLEQFFYITAVLNIINFIVIMNW